MTERAAPSRIAVFGMRCAFTDAVVARLLEDDPEGDRAPIEIAAFVIAMPELGAIGTEFPSRPGREFANVRILGNRARLRDPELQSWLESLHLDAVVVACFPWKIPPWVGELAPAGCLNVHPSLLPDGRGPEPLFWAFRWRLPETGVTVHQIDAGWDTGPIVAQRALTIPETATVASLERELAGLGGDLVREILRDAGSAPLRTIAQAPGSGRYAPSPTDRDLQIDTGWRAAEAARFIQAVVPVYGPVTVIALATGQRWRVAGVVAILPPGDQVPPLRRDNAGIAVAFADGILVQRSVVTGESPLYLHPLRSLHKDTH